MKSPQLLALENTLDILGQQRDHAIFILESRIEENDATASLFAVHRNFLRDQEDFLRAQIKALKESESHKDAHPQSPPIEPSIHPENLASPTPSQVSTTPSSPSRLAQTLAVLLLFLLPAFAHARSATSDRPIACFLLPSAPSFLLQKSPTNHNCCKPNQLATLTASFTQSSPFFSAQRGLIYHHHPNHDPRSG